MRERHEKAGQEVEIKSGTFKGEKYLIEDWWQNVGGKSWMDMHGNPACLNYAMRSAADGLRPDDEVLYGNIGNMGHLIHVSEI